MPVYPGTSFLVSLYVKDNHSAEAADHMAGVDLPILLTPFQELEFLNAVYQRIFRKEINDKQARASLALFARDRDHGFYSLKSFDSGFFERGIRLSKKHASRTGLRTLDLLHVASALELSASVFLTFDARQRTIAMAEGLKVLP